MKIDTTKIKGYAELSDAEKVKLFESFEYEDGHSEIERYKNLNEKANAEAAEWKRKHNALLSEEERKTQETAEKYAAMEKELAELKRGKVISEHKAKFLSLGYEEALADETATAMADGDLAKVFENQKKFLEIHDKALSVEALKSTQTPPAGNGSTDLSAQIEAAKARGDLTAAVTLMRSAEAEK